VGAKKARACIRKITDMNPPRPAKERQLSFGGHNELLGGIVDDAFSGDFGLQIV